MYQHNRLLLMRALSSDTSQHMILTRSPYKDQPQLVLLAVLAQSLWIEQGYQRGLLLSGAPDDGHIVVNLCICPEDAVQGREEVPADEQVAEEYRWLRFRDFAELPNRIKGGIELVSRPGAMAWPLVLQLRELNNSVVRLPDFACLLFEATRRPLHLTDIVFQGAFSLLSNYRAFCHARDLTGVIFQGGLLFVQGSVGPLSPVPYFRKVACWCLAERTSPCCGQISQDS